MLGIQKKSNWIDCRYCIFFIGAKRGRIEGVFGPQDFCGIIRGTSEKLLVLLLLGNTILPCTYCLTYIIKICFVVPFFKNPGSPWFSYCMFSWGDWCWPPIILRSRYSTNKNLFRFENLIFRTEVTSNRNCVTFVFIFHFLIGNDVIASVRHFRCGNPISLNPKWRISDTTSHLVEKRHF